MCAFYTGVEKELKFCLNIGILELLILLDNIQNG